MKKIKVRIAIAVDEKGGWNSCGWETAKDQEMLDLACEFIEEGVPRFFWLESEIELTTPSIPTVQGTITKGD
jgi:hypothetical protein